MYQSTSKILPDKKDGLWWGWLCIE